MNTSFPKAPPPDGHVLLCSLCAKPVPVETAKTDGDGLAIHEDCYVQKVKLDKASRDGHGRSG